MKTLSLYIDRWYIAAAVCYDNIPRRIDLPNREDRIWLYFYEDINNDRVIYIKSFSKIFLPGIRLGYIICPKKFRESIQNSKINTDIATSTLMQRALEMYIKEGQWIGYIDDLKNGYIKRYELMKKLLNEKKWWTF